MNEVNAETNNTVTGEQPLYSIKVKTTIEDYTWAVKANMYTEKPSGIFLTLSFLLSGIALLAFLGSKKYILAVFLITVAVLIILSKFVVFPKRIKRNFEILTDNNENENQYDLYEDHILRINPTGTAIIKYDQISWINEDDRHICFFIPVNKVLIIDKTLCEEGAIDYIKSKVNKDKIEKGKKAFKKKSIVIWVFGVYVALTTIFLIWVNKPFNNYPYTTYESFVGCLDSGYVDEVTFHEEPLRKKTITYRYVNGKSSEYLNTVPPKGYDKGRLLDIIKKRGVTINK